MHISVWPCLLLMAYSVPRATGLPSFTPTRATQSQSKCLAVLGVKHPRGVQTNGHAANLLPRVTDILRCSPGSLLCLCVSPFATGNPAMTRILMSGAYSYAREAVQRYGGNAVVGAEEPIAHLAFTWREQTSLIQIQASHAGLTWDILVAAIGTLDGWLRDNQYQFCHFTILDGITEIAQGVVRNRYPFD